MTTMTTDEAMAIQLAATERLERAEAEHAAAERWCATIAPDAPLRTKLADRLRLDAARAELEAALATYEAAQDLECPEA